VLAALAWGVGKKSCLSLLPTRYSLLPKLYEGAAAAPPIRTGAPDESGTPVFGLSLLLRQAQRATVDVLVEAAAVAAVVACIGRVASGERAVVPALGVLGL
jgi:hypothetical protein